jgi:hypothetical protein
LSILAEDAPGLGSEVLEDWVHDLSRLFMNSDGSYNLSMRSHSHVRLGDELAKGFHSAIFLIGLTWLLLYHIYL